MRTFYQRTGIAAVVVAIAFTALLPLTAFGSDEDVFTYRAYPNMFIVLERGANMGTTVDSAAVGDVDGDGKPTRYDLALKVLFRILNADGSLGPGQKSTPPDSGSVESFRSQINVEDEFYLSERTGLMYFDNTNRSNSLVSAPGGAPFQVYAPDNPPNQPPYVSSASSGGKSWQYMSIWDNVYALGRPNTVDTPVTVDWDTVRKCFITALSGDSAAACRPKVTVLILSPDSFNSNGSLGVGTIVDSTFNPFLLIVGSADNPDSAKIASYSAKNGIPAGRVVVFRSTEDIDGSGIFVNLVAQLNSNSFEFVAPVVPAVRTTDNNRLFLASFTPAKGGTAFWQGHLSSFNLKDDGTVPSPPFINWDAAERLSRRSAERKIYTQVSGARVDFKETTSTTDLPPGTLNASNDTERNAIINSVRALSLGDIFHATPVLVGAPSTYFADATFPAARQEFVTTYAQRKRILIAGANDGMLHGFNSGNYQASFTPPGYDAGTGDEEWAYIPGFLLGNVKNFYTPNINHKYFVDSTPAVSDVWIDRTPLDKSNEKRADEWHTIVIGGAGKGGSGYYALDLTNPSAGEANYPKLLWEISYSATDTTGRQYLGETWSTPAIGKLQLTDSTSGNVYDKWVAIVGAGKSAAASGSSQLHDSVDLLSGSQLIATVKVRSTGSAPSSNGTITLTWTDTSKSNPPTYTVTGTYLSKTDNTFQNVTFTVSGSNKKLYPSPQTVVSWSAGTRGNAILVLDVETGSILQTLTHTTLMGPVAASPVIHNNNLGYIERVYVGDLRGNLWRAVADNVTYLSLGKPTENPFFSVSTAATFSPMIYAKASVSKDVGGGLWIAFGTGDRDNPMDTNSKGAVFVVYDGDTFARGAMATIPKNETGLDNQTSFLASVATDPTTGTFTTTMPTNNGWYGILPNVGEKMTSNPPVVFFNNLYFTTFEPKTGDCDVGGTARVYGFGLLTGTYAMYSDIALANNTSSDARMRAYTSAGIPSSPVISIGSTGVATLYFGTTGSSVRSLKIPSPTTTKSIRYWKEVE